MQKLRLSTISLSRGWCSDAAESSCYCDVHRGSLRGSRCARQAENWPCCSNQASQLRPPSSTGTVNVCRVSCHCRPASRLFSRSSALPSAQNAITVLLRVPYGPPASRSTIGTWMLEHTSSNSRLTPVGPAQRSGPAPAGKTQAIAHIEGRVLMLEYQGACTV